MKQCPKCGSTYADDMNFCLNDGATLLAQTVANQRVEPQPILSEQPKVDPIKVNIGNDAQNVDSIPYLQNQVQSKQKSNSLIYVVGALTLLLAGLAIGATLVYLINRKSNAANNDNVVVASSNSSNRNSNQMTAAVNNNANSKKSNSNIANNNSNSNTSSNANANAKPSPSQTPKPSPSITPVSTPIEHRPMCYLDDNGSGGGEVNVRQNCDVADCENDSSTVAGTYPNKTEIKMLNDGTQTANYKWLKVKLVKQNKVVWVASTKYVCEGE